MGYNQNYAIHIHTNNRRNIRNKRLLSIKIMWDLKCTSFPLWMKYEW